MSIHFFKMPSASGRSFEGWMDWLDRQIPTGDCAEGGIFDTRSGLHLYLVLQDGASAESMIAAMGLESAPIVHGSGQQAAKQWYYDLIGKGTDSIGELSVHTVLDQDFQKCLQHNLIGPVLRHLRDTAAEYVRHLRNTTDLSIGAVTPEALSLELTQRIMEDVRGATVAVVGGPSTAADFTSFWSTQNIDHLYTILRDPAQARSRTNAPAIPVPWDDRRPMLVQADVIILNTDDTEPVLTPTIVRDNLQHRKQYHLLIFNWSDMQPIEESIARMPAVFSYSKDELIRALVQARQKRESVLERLEPQLDARVTEFYQWFHSDERYEFHGIIGASHRMHHVFELVQRVAGTDITVLIQGETGTGKELVARAIHNLSQRRNGPFVAVNCGAIPETLLESELFGHAKGAFTGAENARQGLLKEASGGTVFLDEIGDTSQMFQVKLLRALQEREVTPLGTNLPESIDVRIITATRKDLQNAVNNDQFRTDLFYRINVVRIELPALRDRPQDILPLARHFIRKYNRKMGKNIQGVTDEAAQALVQHPWSGNVRELENVIERAIALTLGKRIGLADLPESLTDTISTDRTGSQKHIKTLEEVEEEYITRLLQEFEGNYAEVAELLGIGRTTLWRKMKKYGLGE